MRHRRTLPLALVGLFLVLVGTTAPAAAAAEEPTLRSLAARSDVDLAGDVSPCHGDITHYGAGYELARGDAVVVVALQTACANDPTADEAWTVGLSYAGWYLDTNGDGSDDFWAFFENSGSGLHGGVYRIGGGVVCGAEPIVESGGLFLGISFLGSCIGQPSSFRIAAELEYDRAPNASATSCASCSVDLAPETGWGPVTSLGEPRQGYWMIGRTGETFTFGDAPFRGSTPAGEVVDLEPTPSGDGYWTVDARGAVYTFGDAVYHGGGPFLAPGEGVTALSATPSGHGYWLFTDRGRVTSFGDAPHLGDMTGVALNGPVLDSIATETGGGYYMVGSDGGIFAFGDALFHGSMGAARLNAPVQSLVPDPDGTGYWLVASDGGIFAFAAEFHGSMGGTPLNRPITGMVGFGRGYLMVGEDGGIFAFGEAPFFGSLGDNPPSQPIVSVAILDEL